SSDLRQGLDHDISAVAVGDDVTTPTFFPKLDHIVPQRRCCPRARDPAIVAGPLENRIALGAVRPAPGRRASLLKCRVEFNNEPISRAHTFGRLVPSARTRPRRRICAVYDYNGLFRGFVHLAFPRRHEISRVYENPSRGKGRCPGVPSPALLSVCWRG